MNSNKAGGLPNGCMWCRCFNRSGCDLSGVIFDPLTNVAVQPKDCPLIIEENAISENFKERTPIEGLEWILEGDRFGFGENWSEGYEPKSEEELAGYYIQRAIDELKFLTFQIKLIKDYGVK